MFVDMNKLGDISLQQTILCKLNKFMREINIPKFIKRIIDRELKNIIHYVLKIKEGDGFHTLIYLPMNSIIFLIILDKSAKVALLTFYELKNFFQELSDQNHLSICDVITNKGQIFFLGM